MKITPDPIKIKQIHDYYKANTTLDPERGFLQFDNVPIIWARTSLLYHMLWEVQALVGDAAVEVMHRIGKPYGQNFFEMSANHLSKESQSPAKDDFLEYLAVETAAIGWGNISIEREGDDIKISCENGFPVGLLTKKNRDLAEYPVDTYFLGYFEGFITAWQGKDYRGKEIECVGKGDKRCLMQFTPK